MNTSPTSLHELPLFPLQSVLFPDGLLPMRIFEVRYLDMIGKCHKAGTPFGVVCLTQGSEVRQREPSASPGGKPTGDGARIVRWLPPGQHKVELQAWDAGSYANSTPAMITAAKVPSRTVQVSVNVNDPGWDCLGRLGAGCNDKPTTNFAATAAVTVSIACRGKPDQVCVSSSMSVGSIKHDRCCQERQEQGKPPGFWCDDRSDKEDPTVCTAEWAQAQFDSKVAELPIFDLVRPSFANARFKHLWVYPPDGSDKPSLGKEGWWQRLAGHGVIMSYSDSQPDKLEQSVCRVGTASRQSIGEMKNSNLAVGPIFSKTHAWICD